MRFQASHPSLVAEPSRAYDHAGESIIEDQARIKIRLKDGRVLERFVAHVIGSVENLMSDAALAEKFSDLCAGVLSGDKMHRLADLCRTP